MTIHEAVKYCRDVEAGLCEKSEEKHKLITDWLAELKIARKEFEKSLKEGKVEK